jgi:TPP-dependent pyruvate/acetoin dehydrogenase alpha subunit
VVYVCENNGFAESTPFVYATSVPTVAARAAAYGIPGVVADGADVLEVYTAAGSAIGRARAGEGPTLLEVTTYRFMGHFEGDPDRYRDDDERTATHEHDAIAALRARLDAREDELDAIRTEIEAAVSQAVDFARASPFPDPAEVDRYVYPL